LEPNFDNIFSHFSIKTLFSSGFSIAAKHSDERISLHPEYANAFFHFIQVGNQVYAHNSRQHCDQHERKYGLNEDIDVFHDRKFSF
jgi:hypothetical protein